MAKEGKKLELYEILAARRAKGIGVSDANPVSQASHAPPPQTEPGSQAPPFRKADAPFSEPVAEHYVTPVEPLPTIEPRPRSPREVVFKLDVAFMLFVVATTLVIASYFLGYKRGREERPTALVTTDDVDSANLGDLSLRNVQPLTKVLIRPPENDYTLVLRSEAAKDVQIDRLNWELAEAIERGRRKSGEEIQGFIFQTSGGDAQYSLAVGLAKTRDDQALDRLRKIYYEMEMSIAREPRPYKTCKISQVKELGAVIQQ